MLNKKKNNKGFTLVELLVVIAIIGILAVVAVPALFKNIEKGKVAELESDISAIRSAALSYYADKGTYPNQVVKLSSDTELQDETELGDLVLEGGSLKNGGSVLDNDHLLINDIESLSNPFDANYIVGNVTTTTSGSGSTSNAITPPAPLTLTIQTTKLSPDGFDKLKTDLGNIVQGELGSYTSGTPIIITIISGNTAS